MIRIASELLDGGQVQLLPDERICEEGECEAVGTVREMVQLGDEWFCPTHAEVEAQP